MRSATASTSLPEPLIWDRPSQACQERLGPDAIARMTRHGAVDGRRCRRLAQTEASA